MVGDRFFLFFFWGDGRGGWQGKGLGVGAEGSRSELLQQLAQVGGPRELPADPGQLVEDGTVQRNAGYQALSTATATPAQLEEETHTRRHYVCAQHKGGLPQWF